YDIFGRGGAEQMSQRLGLPFLGAIPINMQLRANSDRGNPTANFTENDPIAEAFGRMIERVEQQVALASRASGPTLTVN
ncbi:MAG: P-loop NTPase, partial [Phycisphaerales bacterium]|nr:P-loop NTPase [Phycisphaerales bacterium]